MGRVKVTLFLVTVANWIAFGETNTVDEFLVLAADLEARFEVQTVCVAQINTYIETFEVAKMERLEEFSGELE